MLLRRLVCKLYVVRESRQNALISCEIPSYPAQRNSLDLVSKTICHFRLFSETQTGLCTLPLILLRSSLAN